MKSLPFIQHPNQSQCGRIINVEPFLILSILMDGITQWRIHLNWCQNNYTFWLQIGGLSSKKKELHSLQHNKILNLIPWLVFCDFMFVVDVYVPIFFISNHNDTNWIDFIFKPIFFTTTAVIFFRAEYKLILFSVFSFFSRRSIIQLYAFHFSVDGGGRKRT